MVIIIPQPITLYTLYSLWAIFAHQTTRTSTSTKKNKENWQIPSREWRNDSALPCSPYVLHRPSTYTSCDPLIYKLTPQPHALVRTARDLLVSTQPTYSHIHTDKTNPMKFYKVYVEYHVRKHTHTHIRTCSPTHKNKKLSSDGFVVVVSEDMLLPIGFVCLWWRNKVGEGLHGYTCSRHKFFFSRCRSVFVCELYCARSVAAQSTRWTKKSHLIKALSYNLYKDFFALCMFTSEIMCGYLLVRHACHGTVFTGRQGHSVELL